MKNWEKSTCFEHDCSSIFSMLWLAAGHLFLKLVGYWWVEQITATFYLIRNIGRCYNFCLLSWRGGRIRKHSAVMHMVFQNWKFSGFLPSKDLNFPPYLYIFRVHIFMDFNLSNLISMARKQSAIILVNCTLNISLSSLVLFVTKISIYSLTGI